MTAAAGSGPRSSRVWTRAWLGSLFYAVWARGIFAWPRVVRPCVVVVVVVVVTGAGVDGGGGVRANGGKRSAQERLILWLCADIGVTART